LPDADYTGNVLDFIYYYVDGGDEMGTTDYGKWEPHLISSMIHMLSMTVKIHAVWDANLQAVWM
jgi:hypothetical protein